MDFSFKETVEKMGKFEDRWLGGGGGVNGSGGSGGDTVDVEIGNFI